MKKNTRTTKKQEDNRIKQGKIFLPEGDTISVKHITKIDSLQQLTQDQHDKLKAVTEKYAFRSNDYYLSLIDWNDPDDPVRRLIIPNIDELEDWGRIDPSNEEDYTVMPGVEHKYSSTILLLVSNTCEGICRYCFRKRVFFQPEKECLNDIDDMIDYVKNHPEATNILLTGGDPFCLETDYLEKIFRPLREIEHIKTIRIGTKVPVFNPYRIIDDPKLCQMIKRYSLPNKKIYIMTHFSHPNEITEAAAKSLTMLQESDAMIANQCPLIRGVNDDPDVLAELFNKVSFAGVVPYYLFQCRPAVGNKSYTVPIEEGYTIAEHAKRHITGLAKRFRYVMSHSTGKIEIIAKTDDHVYLKYHRAACEEDSGRLLVFKSNPQACWLEDYGEPLQDYRIYDPCLSFGNDKS